MKGLLAVVGVLAGIVALGCLLIAVEDSLDLLEGRPVFGADDFDDSEDWA